MCFAHVIERKSSFRLLTYRNAGAGPVVLCCRRLLILPHLIGRRPYPEGRVPRRGLLFRVADARELRSHPSDDARAELDRNGHSRIRTACAES